MRLDPFLLPVLVATLALTACDFAPEPTPRAEEKSSALSVPLRASNADAAAAMPVPDRGAATLWKVLADALIARNGPGDAARARELLARALKIRDRGWLRAETLLSLADAELLGVPEAASASRRRALSRLEEALPHAVRG